MKNLLLIIIGMMVGVALLFGSQNPQSPGNTATVRGRVVFNGTLAGQPVNTASDPNCPSGPQPNNDGLEDVMVYAKPHVQTSYSVSKLNGTFAFVVPEGGYEIVAWNERLGNHTQSIDIRAGETLALDFTFK